MILIKKNRLILIYFIPKNCMLKPLKIFFLQATSLILMIEIAWILTHILVK